MICTDKTGTLTRNEMTVTELVVGFVSNCVTGIGYDPTGRIEPATTDADHCLRDFLCVGVLASNARLVPPATELPHWHVLGDPTEGAPLVVASKFGIDRAALLSGAVEVGELLFDSTRKLMTSMRQGTDGSVTAWVKGAPESILARSSRIEDGTRVRDITDADRAALLALHTEKASRALRNLAFARRSITLADATTGDIAVIEKDLTVLGFVSMIDPIRTAVPEAMADVISAGVKVNIVTGDFSLTAAAIARQAGLAGDDGLTIVTDTELVSMSDAEVLAHALHCGTVFSRVAPEDKVRIVDLVKNSGRIVAVTASMMPPRCGTRTSASRWASLALMWPSRPRRSCCWTTAFRHWSGPCARAAPSTATSARAC